MVSKLKGAAWTMNLVALILMAAAICYFVYLGIGAFWGETVVLVVAIICSVVLFGAQARHIATLAIGLVGALAILSLTGIIITMTVSVEGTILLAIYIATPLLIAYSAGMLK